MVSKKQETAPEETGKVNADELFESLTGFEEIAVEKAFGKDPSEIANSGKMIKFLRVLAFILAKREGKNDMQAKQYCMSLPVSDLTDLFETVEEEESDEDGDDSGEAEALESPEQN
jgi:hypothetical protein